MKKEYSQMINEKYLCNKTLNVDTIKEGYVLPIVKTDKYNVSKGSGGIIDKNLQYIESSAQLAYNMKNRVYGKYDIDIGKVRYINEEVIYGGFFYEHWGHFIIEIVSRLWYLIKNGQINKKKIVFTIMSNENLKIRDNYKIFFELFGISMDDVLLINEVTKFKKIIIPECSMYPGKYYTKEYIDIFQHISSKIPKNNDIPKKIYLSRTNFKKAKDKEIGEKDIEKFFSDNGFIIVFPEQLSLEEQIQIFRDSEELACVNGTLGHNIMFAKKGKKVTIINKTYKLNKHQELINNAKNANITYVDSHISLFPIAYGKGPFILVINKNLYNYAKKNDYIIKYKFNGLKNFLKKMWYIKHYIKTYKFKIYNDGITDWKKIFKFYILK